MPLTAEDYALLKRPFTAEAVKFRIDGKPYGGKVRVLTYIDARLAVERLTEVDPNWSGYPTFVAHGYQSGGIGLDVGVPVSYELTIKGVTRTDVGQIGPVPYDDKDGRFAKGDFVADDKHAKQALSDAIKRAAVLFGLGSYLYTFGNTYVDVKKHTDRGEGQYLNAEGIKYLTKNYTDFISKPEFVIRFGEPISYGEELNDSVAETGELPDAEPEATEQAQESSVGGQVAESAPNISDDNFIAVIASIFELVGRDPEAGKLWLENRKNKKLAVKKTLKQAVEQGADTDKLDKLLKTNDLEELVGAY